MSGRSPPLYCTLTLIAMQGHQTKSKNETETSNMVVIIYCYIGCKDKATTWYLNGFPDGSNLGSTVYVGEKPTVILYTYINRHAEPPNITKQKTLL